MGIGIGFINGHWNTEKLNSCFFEIKYNFKETKFSPYVALEAGVDRYAYSYTGVDGYAYSSTGVDGSYGYYDYYPRNKFSIGIVSGFQYSFNKNFALITNLKLSAVTHYNNTYKIGIGGGVIYHF